MEENKGEENNHLFHINKGSKKASNNAENRIHNRRKNLFKEQDVDDVKRKREDKNVALRKEVKKNKFAKRRNYGAQVQTDKATTQSVKEKIVYTLEQAQELYKEGMDLMDYFKIISNTDFQLPHFLLLLEYI